MSLSMKSPAGELDRHPALAELRSRLDAYAAQGLTRTLNPVGPANGPRVMVRGRSCLLMASNDYLGLTGHPGLAAAAQEAARAHGVGSGASRLVSGTLDCHAALEEELAGFKGAQAALYLATGYMTNLAAVAGLAGPGDLVVSDELNHASIIDACRLSKAKVRVYPHCDAEAAARILREEAGQGISLLVSDGVFSMDGGLAPAPELLQAAREAGALLVLDDAHSTGVWGESGRGTPEHFGLGHDSDVVVVGTCSKALGCMGGYVTGAREVIDTLINRARSLLYTTAPPPAQVAAVSAALKLVDSEAWRRDKLHSLSSRLRQGFIDAGFVVLSDAGPIIPVLVGEADRAMAVGQALWERGVYAPAMRPPTVAPGTSRIRFTVTAAHDEADMDYTIDALIKAAEEMLN